MPVAHSDRNNGIALIAAADKVRSVAAVAAAAAGHAHNNGFDNLVSLNSAAAAVALEKHAIDVVPNGDTAAAAAADLQGRLSAMSGTCLVNWLPFPHQV